MIKESYSKITFPINTTDPESVIELYLSEFEIAKIEKPEQVSTIFLNALNDYLEEKLSEAGYGSLCFALSSTKKMRDIVDETERPLRTYLYDGVDISWLAGGEKFPEYLNKLRDFLDTVKKSNA